MAVATSAPVPDSMPKVRNWKKICAANTAPVNAPVMITTGCER